VVSQALFEIRHMYSKTRHQYSAPSHERFRIKNIVWKHGKYSRLGL
jgi:hypothetical protein